MYYLSVMSMFKNESMIIRSYIEHYLREGVEHFYLIDNGSTDDYETKISDYMKYITLIKDPTRLGGGGTQSFLYTKHFLQKVKKESKWIIVCDIDEYIYSRLGNKTIPEVLKKYPSHIHNIWICWKIFGSNGNKKQPENIIGSFTKRQKNFKKDKGHGKCISRTEYIENFGCCGHNIGTRMFNEFYYPDGKLMSVNELTEVSVSSYPLQLNHYMLMSEEYYEKIKCNRGGGESGNTQKYTINFFKLQDNYFNEIEDNELFKKIYGDIDKNPIQTQQKNQITVEQKNPITSQQEKIINPIFSENDKIMFYKYLDKSKNYFEYGSGGSTYQASIRSNIKKVFSVESDKEWYDNLVNMGLEKKVKLKFVDLNCLPNNWGYPSIYVNDSDKKKYSSVILKMDKHILSSLDFILIDGRFRVACCLKCFKVIKENCFIAFNDFLDRKQYHIVLDYFDIIEETIDKKMVILKKKNVEKPLDSVIKKYELIAE